MKVKGLPAAVGEFHDGRILLLRGEPLAAARLLDRARQDLAGEPSLAREASLHLGRCYQQLGDNDRRLAAFRRAVPPDPTDPAWVPAVLGVAEAEAALGQTAAALAGYRKVAERDPRAWLPVARLEVIEALRTPLSTRDWRVAAEAVAAAERALPDSPELAVLRAELLHFQGRTTDSREALEAARRKHPTSSGVWLALAAQAERVGDRRGAMDLLTEGVKSAGDSPELRLARARLWATEPTDFESRIESLLDNAEIFGRHRHTQLLKGLAEVAANAGAAHVAAHLWDRVAAVAPDDLTAQLVRFDRATAASDQAGMDRVCAEVERIDGRAGPSAQFLRALRLIGNAQHTGDTSGLREAGELLDGLTRGRVGGPRVALARAVVHDLRREYAAATSKYQQAVEGGEGGPEAVKRLMALLAASGRHTEAEAVFRKLADASDASPDIQRLAAEVSLRTNNLLRAVELAARAVPADSANFGDHLWVGRMYQAAGEASKAEVPFRRAVALRPDSAEAWLTLLNYLIDNRRKADAATEFKMARTKVVADDRPLFIARGLALLGEADAATEAFRAVRQANPSDKATARAEAEFLFQAGRVSDARDAFTRYLRLSGLETADAESARRMLAICYAAEADPDSARRGLEVLGLATEVGVRPATGAETHDQLRTRAVVLALQPDRTSKSEAIRTLERMREKLTPADLFLLAHLYSDTNDRSRARVVLTDLMRSAGRVPMYVGYFALWLLREKDLKAADEWVGRFTELQPNSLLAAELTARLRAARNDLSGARRALLPKADAAVGPVAHICEQIGLQDDAEALYRRLWEESKDTRPEAGLLTAAYFGRRGRTAEALRLCESVRKKVPIVPLVEVAVYILYATETPPADGLKTVAEWAEEAGAVAAGETRTALFRQLAAVRNLQADYPAAIHLYRRVVAANERDALALNNLAFLLSTHEKRYDDALALIERARRVIGRHPDLDDTEALVRLHRGDATTARRLLEAVVAERPTGAAYFRLALAEQADKRELEARAAWVRATEAGLKQTELHPLERADYARLETRWK